MPPLKNRRRLEPAARRRLIDDAATRVFAERGYEAATMQGIARTAGVVASVLYDHYSSKRELYISLLEEHGQQLMERTTRPAEGADPETALRDQIDAFFQAVEAEPFIWRMLFRAPPADASIAAAHEQVQASATEAIAAALSARTTNSPPHANTATSVDTVMVAEMIKSSLTGLGAWWSRNPGASRKDLVQTATALLWDGLSRIARYPR